jgi:hypothetical protein
LGEAAKVAISAIATSLATSPLPERVILCAFSANARGALEAALRNL